jgi:hypothetical protein
MNELFLNKEQVETLTYVECQAALNALAKKYDFDKPLSKSMKEIWPIVDDIANTILYLEDRMTRFEDPRIPSMDPKIAIVRPKKPEGKSKTGRPARRFKINDVIYDNIHDAVKRTGIKLTTLKTYVSRHPHKYSYVD